MPKVEDHGFRPGDPEAIEIESIEVAAWHPDEFAQVPPTQVHLILHIPGIEWPLTLRFKGPDTLDALIAQLMRYRMLVWPNG